ncbi:MAG: SGNH/GDSL hydrolase family protein [Anaerolineae bacterium]
MLRLRSNRLIVLVVILGIAGALQTSASVVLMACGLFVILFLTAGHTDFVFSLFFRRFLLGSIILLLCTAAFNYVMNPYGIYPTRFFRPIVLALRTEKMNLYADQSTVPQMLVLGSSRSFTVDPQQLEQLWGYAAFNASVNAGSIYDALAFTRFAVETRSAPKILILNLEFDNFFPTNPRAVEPDAYLWRYLDDESVLRPFVTGWDHFTRLFTLQQIDFSLRQVRAELAGGWSGIYEVRKDGMVSAPQSDVPLAETISNGLAEYRRINWANAYQIKTIDPDALQQLTRLLELTQSHNIQVLGYVPPFHPEYLQLLDETSTFRPLQRYMLDMYQQLGQNYPLHVMDFLDSDLFKNENPDNIFWDGVHAKEAGSRLIMQALHDAFPLTGIQP